MPVWKRPSIIRLTVLALLPLKGGVLIDSWTTLGDDLDRAVVLEYLLRNNRHTAIRIGGGPRNEATHTMLAKLCRSIDAARFEDARERLWQAFAQEFQCEIDTDFENLRYFGRGPNRDVKRALIDAQLRREAGWSDARIRQYLELYGYTNTSGTVGRWSHEQFHKLWTLIP